MEGQPITDNRQLRLQGISFLAGVLYLVNMGAGASTIELPSEKTAWGILQQQDAECSALVIDLLKGNEAFVALSEKDGAAIIARDNEDGEKLSKGIQIAIDKGVIDKDLVPEPYISVDVFGKTSDQVADEIIGHCGDKTSGMVLVLCGLSGTGKGTTVAKLKQKLPNVTTWSNGNIFRSITLLAATWIEQNGKTDITEALTKENLESFVGMLSFGKHGGDNFDTKISGLGIDALVSEVQNTLLKDTKVSSNIPTVAEVTQGEVINFAAGAVAAMAAEGQNVLLEGREQTVNYVRSPLRFTLIMSDEKVVGMRRAAQRIMGASLQALQVEGGEPTNDAVQAALEAALVSLSS